MTIPMKLTELMQSMQQCFALLPFSAAFEGASPWILVLIDCLPRGRDLEVRRWRSG